MHTIRFDTNGRWVRVPRHEEQAGAAQADGLAPEAAEGPATATSTPAAADTEAAPSAPADSQGACGHASTAGQAVAGVVPTALPMAKPAPAATASSVEIPPEVPVEARSEEDLREDVVRAISTVYDPEIPVDVYQLGLIYDVSIDKEARVNVKMTLTTPACFAAQTLPGEVQRKVEAVPGVRAGKVEIVWDPPWNPSMMSDAAKLALNMPW